MIKNVSNAKLRFYEFCLELLVDNGVHYEPWSKSIQPDAVEL